jgi:prenyl protein peptidase
MSQSPIAEEFIYRACCVLPLLKAPSGSWYSDPWFIILFSPVLFGAAHLHHAWYQVCMKTGSAPSGLNVIWLDAMFQFCYTTIFGWYATWLYLWSECNIWCPILAHCFCNIFGLPEEGGPRGLALGLGIFVIILRFIGI